MVLVTSANGRMLNATAKVTNVGLMVQNTMVYERITGPVVKASSSMLTETFTRENGKTIRPMDTVSTSIQMMLVMKDSGKMINNMGKEKNPGLMELFMKESTAKVKSTAKEL